MHDVIDAYRAALSGGDLLTFPITALDHTGVPVWTVCRLGPDGSAVTGVGYGTTDEEAIVSAFGEAAESAGAAAVVPTLQRVTGSFRELAGRGAVDPVSLCLEAGSPYTPDTQLTWVPATRWRTGETVLLPEAAVAVSPGQLQGRGPALMTPITNGLGAGDTLERAIAHALLELVQRDGNSVSQRALDTGVGVDAAPSLPPLEIVVKACDDDLGIANVVAVGAEADDDDVPFPLCVTGCGEAAHPDRDLAIRKAALELCSSRVRKAFIFGPEALVASVAPEPYVRWARTVRPERQEPRALAAARAWLQLDAATLRARIADPVLRVRRTVAPETLPHTNVEAEPAAVLALVLERLAAFDVLWVDLTPPGSPIRAVKVLAPGLEVETASYGRIGERNLQRLLERDLGLVGHGTAPPGAAPIHRPPGAPPAWLHRERLDARVRDLYALYREPGRHATMGDLVAWRDATPAIRTRAGAPQVSAAMIG